MSAGTVTIKAINLVDFVSSIISLFPKGSTTIPIGVSLGGDTITFTCTTGCYYQAEYDVSNPDNVSKSMTVMFCNIVDYLPTIEDIAISFQSRAMNISGAGFEISLPMGYSLVNKLDFTGYQFETIVGKQYIAALKDLMSLNLSGIYMHEVPVNIYRNVSVIKYPNLMAMSRTEGLTFSGSIIPDHVKLLCKFSGGEVCDSDEDSLIFRRGNSYLQLPRKRLYEENTFLRQMEGLSEPYNISFSGYINRLRAMSKLGNNAKCKLVLLNDGLKTTVSTNSIVLTDKIGKCQDKVVKTFELPITVWSMIVKALGNGTVQILYRGDVLCLRTQYLIILTRALA